MGGLVSLAVWTSAAQSLTIISNRWGAASAPAALLAAPCMRPALTCPPRLNLSVVVTVVLVR